MYSNMARTFLDEVYSVRFLSIEVWGDPVGLTKRWDISWGCTTFTQRGWEIPWKFSSLGEGKTWIIHGWFFQCYVSLPKSIYILSSVLLVCFTGIIDLSNVRTNVNQAVKGRPRGPRTLAGCGRPLWQRQHCGLAEKALGANVGYLLLIKHGNGTTPIIGGSYKQNICKWL